MKGSTHSYCTLLDCKEECVGVIFSHHHPLCSCHRLSRCLNKQCSIIVNGLSSSKFLAPESLQPMSYFFLCSVLLQSVFDFFFSTSNCFSCQTDPVVKQESDRMDDADLSFPLSIVYNDSDTLAHPAVSGHRDSPSRHIPSQSGTPNSFVHTFHC